MLKYLNFIIPLFSFIALTTHAIDNDCNHLLIGIDQNIAVKTNTFNTRRDFKAYQQKLSTDKVSLNSTIRNLKAGDLYIDVGAGEANALIDIAEEIPSLNLLAIAYLKPQSPRLSAALINYSNKFNYLSGAFIEELAATEKLNEYLGKAALITENFGPTCYSYDLQQVLNIDLSLLKKDGIMFFNLAEKTAATGDKPLNQFLSANGDEISFESILRSTDGITVLDTKLISTLAYQGEISRTYVIRKDKTDAKISNLKTEVYQHEIVPPLRVFRQTSLNDLR